MAVRDDTPHARQTRVPLRVERLRLLASRTCGPRTHQASLHCGPALIYCTRQLLRAASWWRGVPPVQMDGDWSAALNTSRKKYIV